jgi:hypothetical protein
VITKVQKKKLTMKNKLQTLTRGKIATCNDDDDDDDDGKLGRAARSIRIVCRGLASHRESARSNKAPPLHDSDINA